jgi:hypothetical protein
MEVVKAGVGCGDGLGSEHYYPTDCDEQEVTFENG